MDWVIRIFLYVELKRVLKAFFIANGDVDIDAFNLLFITRQQSCVRIWQAIEAASFFRNF